jgi:hypothetical protein
MMPGRAKQQAAGRSKREPVEVYVVEPGEGRPPFSFEGAHEYLPADGPMPAVGDVLLLPRQVSGDTKKQAFAWGGTLAPFLVVEREHVFFREKGEKPDPASPKPARYVKTVINVRRLTEEQFYAEPGHAIG